MPPKKKKSKKDGINRDKIEEEYGLSYALFKAFPELDDLLKKAVKEGYSASKFQVELRQTKWFKRHSDIWREHTALKYSDPSSYRERLVNSRTLVDNLAAAYSARMSPKARRRLAERALLFGMNEDQIRDVLAKHVRPSDAGQYTGQLTQVEEGLRQTAMRNGIHLNKKSLRNWMQRVVRGNASSDQLENFIRRQAASTFKLYGEQIRGGMDLVDIASPYVQAMAQTLELSPTSLDLFDPTIRKALRGNLNDKNERVETSIVDFEESLRRDRRWQYTDSAKDQARGYAANLSRMWGLS